MVGVLRPRHCHACLVDYLWNVNLSEPALPEAGFEHPEQCFQWTIFVDILCVISFVIVSSAKLNFFTKLINNFHYQKD